MDTTDQTKQDATPSYFKMEPHQREEILSHIGSFSQIQYQIFHSICDFWDPALEYNKYILKAKKPALVNKNQLELLMNKIQDAHMGLLQYKLTENELRPHRIVLTEKDSPYFYYYICEEVLYRNYYENGHPFITAKNLEKHELNLPGKFITPIEPKILGPAFHAKMIPRHKIFGITRHNRSPIIIPSGMLDEYIHFLIQYLIRESQSMTLLENLSRLANIKISELQKKMGSRDPAFWLVFTRTLIEHKEDFKIRIKGISSLIFTSAQLLYSYFANTMGELKQKQQESQEKQKTREEIIDGIREKATKWSSLKELDDQLKEKEKKWPGFRDTFTDEILKRQEGGDQPMLIVLGGQLIHKDYLFPYFKSKMDYFSREFQILYQDMMADLLRNGQTDKYTQFYSRNNFRADILNRIRNKSPQMTELLHKPALMANVTYYYLKDLKGVKKSDTIRETMGIYFRNDLKQYQNIDEIMNLSLIVLFDQSYRNLSWWNKLVLKFTGKYDSYTNTFTNTVRANEKGKRRKGPELHPVIPTDEEPSPVTRRRAAQEKKNRIHSVREKRKAWDEFSDLVNRKK